jgi:hypothetical protein
VRSRAGDEGAVPVAQFKNRLADLVRSKSLEGAGHLLPPAPEA